MLQYLLVMLSLVSFSTQSSQEGNGTSTIGPTEVFEPSSTTHHHYHHRYGSRRTGSTNIPTSFTDPPEFSCPPEVFTNTSGEFSPPSFRHMDEYPNNLDCSWGIALAAGQRIKLVITSIDIEFSINCINDKLEVFDGPDENSPSLAVLCGRPSNLTLTSTGNTMYVVFRADATVRGAGFTATYKSLAPGECADEKVLKKGSDRDSFEFWDSRNRTDIDDMLKGSGKTFSGLNKKNIRFNVQEKMLKKFVPYGRIRTRYVKQIQFVFNEDVTSKYEKLELTIDIENTQKWVVTEIPGNKKIQRLSLTCFWDSNLKKKKAAKAQVKDLQVDACFD